MKNTNRLFIDKQSTIHSTLKKMDQERTKLLIVGSENKFEGLISIGDLQRAIIKNLELSKPIAEILRKDIIVASIDESNAEIKKKDAPNTGRIYACNKYSE